VTGTHRAPSLTAEQRRVALEKATLVRMARRAFKDEVARGAQGIAAIIALAKADETLAGIKAYDLLTSLPGIGPKRAARLMTEAGIAPTRRIRGLGEHQVAKLIARLTP
jgi:predicted flap endonuclease-1-like 5' DNA nuclease